MTATPASTQAPRVPPAVAEHGPGAAVQRLGLRISTPDGRSEIDVEPLQGLWTQAQYLRLTDNARLLIEFTDGRLEVLPMPPDRHQAHPAVPVSWLWPRWSGRAAGRSASLPCAFAFVRTSFREPDLLLVRDAGDPRRRNDYWRGADLVMEIVSPDDPQRDTQVKRGDYAEARIPEYWIVNPLDETITVLTLAGAEYAEHGVFRRGDRAESALLKGFAAGVADVFDAA